MPKLTQKTVDNKTHPKTGQILVRDDEIIGFGLRVSQATKAYFVESRVNGKARRVTLGRADRMSIEEARQEARYVLAEMSSGVDPNAAKKAEKVSALTLDELLEIYLAAKELRESTKSFYRRIIRRCLKDWLDKPITAITRDMVEDRHKQMSNGTTKGTSGRATANGCFKTLQALLNYAAERYEIDGQPLILIKPCREADTH